MGDPEGQVVLPLDGVQQALVDAAGACLARWGVSKTTVADLATEAGCSRATVYRAFPGGKNQIMAVYGVRELTGYFDEAASLVATAATLEDALVELITTAARTLAEHHGFQFMLTHEPGLVLPYLGFTNIDRLYLLAAERLAPSFHRFVGDEATRLVELVARITLSHTFQPSDTLDLRDVHDVRRLVVGHLLPICEQHPSDRFVPSSPSTAVPTAVPA